MGREEPEAAEELDGVLATLRDRLEKIDPKKRIGLTATLSPELGILVHAPHAERKPIFLTRALRGSDEQLVRDAERIFAILLEPNPLERYRLRNDLSYPQLASTLGLSVAMVYAYCHGSNSPSLARRQFIAAKTKGEVPVDGDWPLPPREAHRPKGSRNRSKADGSEPEGGR